MEKANVFLGSNKLIAEFIGTLKSPNKKTIWFKNYNPILNKKIVFINQLKYHESWDWLMPVVEKCLMGEAEHEKKGNELVNNIYEALTNISIIETYKAVIEFIKWYNNENR